MNALQHRATLKHLRDAGFRRYGRRDDGRPLAWSVRVYADWDDFVDVDLYVRDDGRTRIVANAYGAVASTSTMAASLSDALDCVDAILSALRLVCSIDPQREREASAVSERVRVGLGLPFPKRRFALSEIGGSE